jgi:hypothetical protein
MLPSEYWGKRRSENSFSNGARFRTTPTNRALGLLTNWAEISAEFIAAAIWTATEIVFQVPVVRSFVSHWAGWAAEIPAGHSLEPMPSRPSSAAGLQNFAPSPSK